MLLYQSASTQLLFRGMQPESLSNQSKALQRRRGVQWSILQQKISFLFFFRIRNLAPLSANSESRQLVLSTTLAVNSRY